MPVLLDLFPSAKSIACVRNVAWIMDSIERLYQANPYENTRLYSSDAERSSVYSRLEALAQRTRMVGLAYSALKEAYYGAHGRSMLVLGFSNLGRFDRSRLAALLEGDAPRPVPIVRPTGTESERGG